MSFQHENRHVLVANKLLIAMSGLTRWTKRQDSFLYEQHHYNIPGPFLALKWTKSRIRHLLTLLSHCDDQGVLSLMESEALAHYARTSVRSLHNNLRLFESVGLIRYSIHFSGVVTIELVDYLENYRDLFEEDGTYTSKTGYTSLWCGMVRQLMDIEHVNILRVALRALVQVERDVNVQSQEKATLTYDEVRGFLPRYCGHRLAVKGLLDQLSQFFNVHLVENTKDFLSAVKENVSLKKRIHTVTRPLMFHVKLEDQINSKRIREAERARTLISWFDLREVARDYVNFDALEVPQTSLQSLSDTYGFAACDAVIRSIRNDFYQYGDRLEDAELYRLFFESPILYLNERLRVVSEKLAIA